MASASFWEETTQLEITIARIREIVGTIDTSGLPCVGSPNVLDSHKPDSFSLNHFSGEGKARAIPPRISPVIAVHRFRPMIKTFVVRSDEKPGLVLFRQKYLCVLFAFGPWCSSGHWWNPSSEWSHEEWDVAFKMNEQIGQYRIYFDEIGKKWFIECMYD